MFSLRKDYLLAFLLFVCLFVIYVLGVSRSVYGGDSGDVILAAYFGGVAHPPGYPLNSLIGFVFTHLPVSGTIAYKFDLMMAFFSAGTIGVLFLGLKKLFGNIFVALCASLVLAFTPLFWLYSHVAEVFQLNLFLVAVSFAFLIFWEGQKIVKGRKLKRDLLLKLSVFFLGSAAFYHQTSVLLIPPYLYLIFKTERRWLSLSKEGFFLFLAFLLGGVFYVAVPFLAFRQPPVNWDNPTSLNNLIHLIMRADYGSFSASTSFIGFSYKARFLQVVSYFAFAKNDFTFVGLIITVVGAFYCFFKNRKFFWFLFWSAFLTGPFFLFYSSFSLSSDLLFGLWERFILLSYFFLAGYIAWGLYFIYQEMPKLFLRFKLGKNLVLLLVGLSFFLLPLYMFRANWDKADMSSFELGDWLGNDVLASSVGNSIIFLFDDTAAFNAQYIYYTNSKFADRKIIIGGILRHPYYRQQLIRQYPQLNFPQEFSDNSSLDSGVYISKLINANYKKFPIYSVDFSPEIDGYKWVSAGLLKALVPKNDASDPTYVHDLTMGAVDSLLINIDEANLGYSNFIPQSIKRIYSVSLSESGDTLLVSGYNKEAYDLYLEALHLKPDYVTPYLGIIKAKLAEQDCSGMDLFVRGAITTGSSDFHTFSVLSDEARMCGNNLDLSKQYEDKANQLKKISQEEPIG